ncbi:hypothetical protein MTO96_018879 [Rhipicephalus appendiculatus]
MQQYPQSAYSPGHPFPASDATSPSHLSPYPTQAPNSPQYRGSYPSPRRPTTTPPAGSPSVVTSQQSSSQGSYPSPGATHLSSPGQVLSPGSGATASATPVASSSLQQLEQMVMPHMATAKPPSATTSSTGSYYGSAVQQSYGPAQTQQGLGYGGMPSTAQHHAYPGPNLMTRARPLTGTPEASTFGTSEVGPMAANTSMPARSDYPMGAAGPARTAPVSPASYAAYTQQQPVSSLGYEQAQQQLQHLYSVPQTAQTQKRISELQERLRILQQQQQQSALPSPSASAASVPGMGGAMGNSMGPMGSPSSLGAYPTQYSQGAGTGVPTASAPYTQQRQMPQAPAQPPQQLTAQQQPHPQLPPYGPQAQQQLMQNSQLQPQPPRVYPPQGLQPQAMPPQGLQPQTLQPQGLQPQGLQPQSLQPQQQTSASVGMVVSSSASSVPPPSPTVSTLFSSMADSYRPPSQPPSLPTPMISDQDLQSSLPPLPLAGVPSVVPASVDDLCPLEGPLSSSLDVPYACPLPPEDPYLLPPDDVLPPIEPMTKRKPSRSKKKAKTSQEMPPLGLGPGEGLMPPDFMMPPGSPGGMPLLLPQPPGMEVPPPPVAKKSKKRKPKEPKEGEPPKEPKPKKPKKPKAPKPPKEPKEGGAPKRKSKSKKKTAAEQEAAAAAAAAAQVPPSDGQDPGAPLPEAALEQTEGSSTVDAAVAAVAAGTDMAVPTLSTADGQLPTDEVKADGEAAQPAEEGKTPKKKSKEKKEKKEPKTPKEGTPKTPKAPKKKLPRLSLKFSKKKKRKRLGSSDKSDLEATPPPSPEEGDGGVQKRRSSRNTHRKKYTDDIELQLSGDEAVLDGLHASHALRGQESKNVQVLVNVVTEDTMVVEKILASRMATRKSEEEDKEPMEVEEFFVKYKNLSYIHCDWKTLEELEMTDKRVLQKVKRFRQKKDNINSIFDFLEDEPFNPDYVEVDRILDMTETVDPIEGDDANQADVKDEKPAMKTEENISEGEVKAEPMDTTEPVEHNGDGDECKVQEQAENKMTEDKTEGDGNGEPQNCTSEPVEEAKKEDSGDASEISSAPAAVGESPDSSMREDGTTSLPEPPIKKELLDEEIPDSVKPEDDNVFEDTAATTAVKSDGDVVPKEEKPEQSKAGSSDESDSSKPKPVRTTHKHYLVKWRGLSYEESTWELEEDVDPLKVEHFLRFKDPPPKEKWKVKKRPKPSEWKQIDESPVYKGGNTLREYQLEGLSWLTFCWYNGQNCILADEMGLGKTIQSLTFINEIVRYGINGPFLVIAPLSTIGNWQREFETWTDLNVITYHGSSASRNMIQEYEMYYKDENGQRITDVYKFQVMITTFEIVLSDCMELQALPWRACVIDEAHRLKNRNCKLLEGLRMLNLEHSVLLTGTPLQNNVEELFSLLNFLEPSRFSSTETFMEEFGDLKTEGQVDKLKALLKPMMLRRLKEDVEKSLAPKEETIVEVELTNIQKKYYRAILERNFAFLTKGGVGTNVPNLMNTMMELRKCCIHPYLIKGAEEQILQEYRLQHGDSLDMTLNALVQASGKLVLLDKLLPKLKDGGHRVLVFSQMVRCLDLLEDYLVHKRYPYERIDGRVRGNLRQAAIDRFCKPDSDRFVFLLCTRAGGLGINLTAADTVVIFDSDWNPQNDLQAQARCHRIGQSKAVKVYRLICRNTYEREMFDKASLKLGLDRAVLQVPMVPLWMMMVKGNNFCEEDIDQILLRRTHTITIESEGKGSTFSKASFTASSTRSDIEIDDPNFWEKWAKKANLDVDELKGRNELILQEPRRRTQTKRFGTDDNMLDLSELESSDEDDETGVRTRGSRRSRHRDSPIIGGRARRGGRASRGFCEDEFLGDIAPGNWTRTECFQVEKGLLTFGWGRWEESIAIGLWRRRVMPKDVEDISRVVLLYCLRHYKGDEKIKGFIWDLIAPSEDGETRIHKNHSGLSAPVPRGRKGKKLKNGKGEPDSPDMLADWARDDQYNPDLLLCDDGYRKHLHRHANKVLLRVRLLYYLKHEIIGDLHQQVFAGMPARDIPIPPPAADGEPPAPWWDEDADKSLLIGVYKHGYERFNLMRQDHTLCFLARCGPPDGAALLAEMTANPEDLEDKREEGKKDLDEEEPVSPEPSTSSEAKPPSESSEQVAPTGEQPAPAPNPAVPTTTVPQVPGEVGTLEFPSPSDLNTRLRRIITMYQRNHKKRELINAQRARILTAIQVEGFNFVNRMERREKFEAAIREREIRRLETQQRWSRREEAEFYRAVSCYGVDYRRQEQRFVWDGFRTVGRLERKRDDTLTEYFRAFRAMCRRVCGRKLGEEDENLQHDKDLLIGAAKYGLSRMDYHLLNDGELSFREVVRAQSASKPPLVIVGHHGHTFPVATTSDATMPTIIKTSVDNDLELCPEMAAQDAVVPPSSKDEDAVLPQSVDTTVNSSSENEKPAPETSVEAEKSASGEESVLEVAKKHDEDTVQSEAVNAKSEEVCSPKVSLQECEMSDKEELSQKSPEHEDNCMKGSIEEEPVKAVEGNDINEVAPVSDEPSENQALKQALLECSKKEEAIELSELPSEEPKKSEEKESMDIVPEMENEPDKVLSEPTSMETTEGKSLEINDDEAKDEELQKTSTTEENQQEQPASSDNSTVQEASSASLGCTPLEMSVPGLVPPPPYG